MVTIIINLEIQIKVFLDFLEFMQKFVSNLAKKCVDIVHEYNKKAIMFVEITGLELNHMGNILKISV